jgi:hypothetical protein
VAQVPMNQKLWALIVSQAKAKYSNYPNPGASHWVHQQYLKNGGKFEETSEQTRRKKILARQFEAKRHAKMAKLKEQRSTDKKKDHKKKEDE